MANLGLELLAVGGLVKAAYRFTGGNAGGSLGWNAMYGQQPMSARDWMTATYEPSLADTTQYQLGRAAQDALPRNTLSRHLLAKEKNLEREALGLHELGGVAARQHWANRVPILGDLYWGLMSLFNNDVYRQNLREYYGQDVAQKIYEDKLKNLTPVEEKIDTDRAALEAQRDRLTGLADKEEALVQSRIKRQQTGTERLTAPSAPPGGFGGFGGTPGAPPRQSQRAAGLPGGNRSSTNAPPV